MIPTGPAALVQRGAGSVRRREMTEVAYDKRIGDETRPSKGNYFCSCLKGSLLRFSFFFYSFAFAEAKNNLQMVSSPEERVVFLF